MRKLTKKLLSMLLAVILVCGSAPLAALEGLDFSNLGNLFSVKAKAIEASDLPADFDLAKYNVKTIFDSEYGDGRPYRIFYDDISKYSYSKIVYNAFSQDADFIASVEAWEAIRLIANPSHLTEYLEYQQQYEKLIFAVLFSALKNAKYAEFSYSNMLTKVTSVTDNLLSTSRTAALLDKTSLDGTEADEIKDIAFAFLTNGKDVKSKWAAFGEYTNIVNKCNSIVDKSISAVVNAANIVTSTVMYVSMLEQGEQILTYLTDLKTKSPNSVFGAAVSTVINTLCQDWLGVVEKAIIDSGFVVGMKATEILFDYAWSGCCAMCPFLGGMAIGEVIGTLACNILFSTENLIEQFEYLKIVTQLETAACSLYQQYGNSCKDSVNSANAEKLMFATDFSNALFIMGVESALELMNIGCNKGIVNKVANVFGVGREQSFDVFEESADVFLFSMELAYSDMKDFWKFYIEEDYPEFFVKVSEDEVIAPKYIESINIEKDEVVFRVGDIMNFKRTINPTDYEGGIGLKSDNEAVLKSSEPMDILPIALEENIGTANVTIYSINNPEICDTIKITVIGEDDEGTTEADNKYITGKCGTGLTYTFNKNTGRLVISGTGAMTNWSSSSKAPWYSYRSSIKKVTIGNSVTSIGDWAFSYCDSLTSITIPNSVTSIGDYAFYWCDSLTSITIPDSVTSIGGYAFYDCDSLTSVTIPDSVTSIGEEAFWSCDSLTSVTIPDSVTSIGYYAFCYCTSLTSITIPDSVTSIGYHAFDGCVGLENIVIGDKVTSLSGFNFKSYKNLKSITIGNSVTSIGYDAFDGCVGLENIVIGDKVTSLSGFDFESYKNLKSITIGNSVTSIGNSAFRYCTSLTSVTIGNSVTSIGNSAFRYCTSLTSITIPDSVTSIGVEAFSNCTSLTSITVDGNNQYYSGDNYGVLFNKNKTELIQYPAGNKRTSYSIPDSVTSIGRSAFSSCTSLTSITIPNSVTSIGDDAFWSCDSLTNVTIGNSVTSIGKNAFRDCDSLTSITIPNSVTSIGDRAFYGCVGLENIVIGDKVTSLSGFNFKSYKNLKSVTIGNSVTSIGEEVFYKCTSLTSITIGNSVTSIGADAFYGCDSLTSITIGNSVTSIGRYAFSNCTGLTSITIPNSVTSIGGFAFVDCNSLTDVYYTGDFAGWCNISFTHNASNPMFCADNLYIGSKLLSGDIVIPDSVTSIGADAFYGCDSLTSITIPDSVTSIGAYAFCACDNLTSVTIPDSVTSIGDYAFSYVFDDNNICKLVYYPGTPKQWKEISIGNFAFGDHRTIYECNSDKPYYQSGSYSDNLSYVLYIDGELVISGTGDMQSFLHSMMPWNDSLIKTLTIGNSVTSIAVWAFDGCDSLTSVTIPDSVTSIGYEAFCNCDSLTDVYYGGTQEQWNKISIGSYNEDLTNANIHFNSSGGHSHSWGEWTLRTAPTTTSNGEEYRVCSVCGTEETRVIPILNSVKDEETRIEIQFTDEYDKDIEIVVTEISEGDAFELITNEYGNANTAIFDISTLKDGKKVQPNGMVKVRIPLPEGFGTGNIFVCYVDSENGTVTTIPANVVDGYVEFETDHFSYYAVVEVKKVNSVSIGDITMNYKKTATITPEIDAEEGLEYTVEYKSSNTKIATVDKNGNVTATGKGNAVITCTVTDEYGNEVSDTCNVTVKYSFGQWLLIIFLFGWIWY